MAKALLNIETLSVTGYGLRFFQVSFVYGSKEGNSLISDDAPGPGAPKQKSILAVTILVLFSTENNN